MLRVSRVSGFTNSRLKAKYTTAAVSAEMMIDSQRMLRP